MANKFIVYSVLFVVLASHSEAFGVVRVDIQKDNGVALANAINNAIASKIQSWNNILNSLLQVKTSYTTVSGTASGTASDSSSGSSVSGTAAIVPLYQKIVTVNSGYASAGPPTGRVAASIDESENEVTPVPTTASTGAVAGGSALVTVHKAFGGIPSAAVLASSSPTAATSGAATVYVKTPVVYTYRKRYIYA